MSPFQRSGSIPFLPMSGPRILGLAVILRPLQWPRFAEQSGGCVAAIDRRPRSDGDWSKDLIARDCRSGPSTHRVPRPWQENQGPSPRTEDSDRKLPGVAVAGNHRDPFGFPKGRYSGNLKGQGLSALLDQCTGFGFDPISDLDRQGRPENHCNGVKRSQNPIPLAGHDALCLLASKNQCPLENRTTGGSGIAAGDRGTPLSWENPEPSFTKKERDLSRCGICDV